MPGAGEDAAAQPVVSRTGEDDWRAWREIRLAALADAPASSADTAEEAGALGEPDWRAMTRDGAIFVATVGPKAGSGPYFGMVTTEGVRLSRGMACDCPL